MACPTCDHTMNGIGHGLFWCPRCGTLKRANTTVGASEAPKLVERCRLFELGFQPQRLLGVVDPKEAQWQMAQAWHRLGIAEAINLPAERGKT